MNSNSVNPRKVLGRGLEALLQPISSLPAQTSEPGTLAVRLVPVANLEPNPFQPRRSFPAQTLEELAASIREQGILQPILVRPLPQDRFQLVAGERRWRAAQLAGFAEIPALVQPLSDERTLEIAIIENLQREDLNPMDQARGLQQLVVNFRLTQEQIAVRTGKERTTVANFLRLLKLDPDVQILVESGRLSMGHARALLALNGEPQRILARRVADQGWSVRQVERYLSPRPRSAARELPQRDPNIRAAEDELARSLGARIRINDHNQVGTITIEYSGLDEFQRIFGRLLGHAN